MGADDQNDAQTQAKAEFRDWLAKQLDTLTPDERRELMALRLKLQSEPTIADLQRQSQLFKKAGLLSEEANIELDKAGFARVKESDLTSAEAAALDYFVKLSLAEERDSMS